MKFSQLSFGLLLGASLSFYAHADEWNFAPAKKSESEVPADQKIVRTRAEIRQKTLQLKNGPTFKQTEDVEFNTAKKYSIDQKTQELITQLETLVQREGQKARQGELKMRLAELYFERARAVAAQESEAWEESIKKWEKLSAEAQAKETRPVLKTPKANGYRNKALSLYRELEKDSRGSDQGRSRLIRRDEVLFFLGSSAVSMGFQEEAVRAFEEFIAKYQSSMRAFSSRLQLADLYFSQGKFEKGIPLYLRVAAGEGAKEGGIEDLEQFQSYALYKLGWSYLNTKQADKAVMALQRTLEKAKEMKSERRLAFEKEAAKDLIRAFAMADRFDEGEKFYENGNDVLKNLLVEYYLQAAEIARDHGRLDIAKNFYLKLIAKTDENELKRASYFELLDLLKKNSSLKEYVATVQDYSQKILEISSSEESQEFVDLLRRETKFYHRSMQTVKRGQKLAFTTLEVEQLYQIYFSLVPEKVADTEQNISEMSFFFAELLFKAEKFAEAAKYYSMVSVGNYSSSAQYAKIIALQNAVSKKQADAKQLDVAIEEFLEKNPKDPRSAELIYSQAYTAFESNDNERSLEILERVIKQFPATDKGIEAANRVLFIHDKNNDMGLLVKKADEFLENEKLASFGGKAFAQQLENIRDKAKFKTLEKSTLSAAEKSVAFSELASVVKTRELKEKSMQNAYVFANQSGDQAVISKAKLGFVQQFPDSDLAQELKLSEADDLLDKGEWHQALSLYEAQYKKKTKGVALENVLWNIVYIRAHLEDVMEPRLHPLKDFSSGLAAYLDEFLGAYPKSKNKDAAVELLVYKKTSPRKIPTLPKLLAHDFKIIQAARRYNAKDAQKLLKEFPWPKLADSSPVVIREALAELAFKVVEPEFTAYQKIKLPIQKPAVFVKNLKLKINTLEQLEKAYLNVVGYGYGDWAFRSLERISKLYSNLASDINAMAVKSSEEERKVLDESYVSPLRNKSKSFLETCLTKSIEIKAAGQGRQACEVALLGMDAGRFDLRAEKIPPVQFVPTLPQDLGNPLVAKTLKAFSDKKNGEFLLGLSILKRKFAAQEKEWLAFFEALWLWETAKGELAVKKFRELLVLQDNDKFKFVGQAAQRNLIAIYLNVGDYESAVDVSRENPDFDSLSMQSLASRALNKPEAALESINQALRLRKEDAVAMYQKAHILASMNRFDEAAKAMQIYIEKTLPPASDKSRQLLKEWKGKKS